MASAARLCRWIVGFMLLWLPGTAGAASAPDHGRLSGTVVYQPMAGAVWRYARYYVQDASQGYLAEAVVALRQRNLRGLPAIVDQVPAAVMDQRDHQFVPETIVIRAGQSVQFKNSDPTTHNVRATAPIANFNVNMPPAGEFTQVFSKAGGLRQPVELGCVFHGAMRAWIFVMDHGYYAVTKGDGRFQFDAVPAGSYRLELVHPAGGFRWSKPVQVQSGEKLKVEIVVPARD